VKAFHGIPVRNFRGFLCIKTKEPLPDDVISIAEETLQGAHLAPRRWGQGDLVAWARQFFNDPYAPPNGRCDSLIPLRK
ncbi:TraC family protein, partial [Micrococcus sp. SIMBA_131]